MPVRVGDCAPPFALPAKPGEVVDVGALFGKEKVLLLFIPLAFSPVCTAELCTFRDTWDRWSGLGAKVFALSVDSPFVVDRFRQAENIPFPVLSDFNKSVCRAYDAIHEDLMGLHGIAKRSAFVVGADGRIVYAWVSEDPRTQVDFEAIRQAVASA